MMKKCQINLTRRLRVRNLTINKERVVTQTGNQLEGTTKTLVIWFQDFEAILSLISMVMNSLWCVKKCLKNTLQFIINIRWKVKELARSCKVTRSPSMLKVLAHDSFKQCKTCAINGLTPDQLLKSGQNFRQTRTCSLQFTKNEIKQKYLLIRNQTKALKSTKARL